MTRKDLQKKHQLDQATYNFAAKLTQVIVESASKASVSQYVTNTPGTLVLRIAELLGVVAARQPGYLSDQAFCLPWADENRRFHRVDQRAQLGDVQLPAAVMIEVFPAVAGTDHVKAIFAQRVDITADQVPVASMPGRRAQLSQFLLGYPVLIIRIMNQILENEEQPVLTLCTFRRHRRHTFHCCAAVCTRAAYIRTIQLQSSVQTGASTNQRPTTKLSSASVGLSKKR